MDMNIGFFTETYYPTPDGVSHYLRDVKKELEGMGHDVFVFTLSGDTKEKNVFSTLTVPLFLYKQYRAPVSIFPFGLYRKMLKTKLDVVNIHSSFFMGTLGYRVARAKNIPIIATFHTDFSKMKESISMPLKDLFFWISWRYNLFLYRRCNLVVCPSNIAADIMHGVGMKRVEALSLFVDGSTFSPSSKGSSGKTILYVGRLTKDKGVDKIVKLADRMKEDGDYRFSISGVGPEEYTIEKLIHNLELGKNVSLNGFVDENEKIRQLQDCYLFVHPSESDTFGIAVLEALASGKPAIVSKNFPLLGYCDSGDCGMVPVDFTQTEDVYSAIRALSENKQRYKELSENAAKFAREKFSPKRHAERLVEIYTNNSAK